MPGRLTSVGRAMVDRATVEQSSWRSIVASITLVLAIAVADYGAGPNVHLAVVYLVPVFMATWNAGRAWGIGIAVASALLSSGGDVLDARARDTLIVPVVMLVLGTAMFLAFVLVLTELRRALEREKTLAREDFLTGTANRRHFLEMAEAEISRATRYRRPLTVAYVDLDNFKDVNDRLGHDVGDEVLRTVADAMKDRLRITDVIGRLGGDEFAVCLPETSAEAATTVLEDVRRQVTERLPERCREVTVSIGAVTFASPPDHVEELLRLADDALYEAKREGKNRLRLQIAGTA